MGIIMIRKAELKDIPAVMDIYNDAILHTTATFDTEIKDYEDRLAWFQAHTGQYVIFVYEEAGTVAGYASLSRYRERKAFDSAVEISIYIHAGYRGRGIGRPQSHGENIAICQRVPADRNSCFTDYQ